MTLLRRPARPPMRETIAPLIDVVFFLLVFALLAGRMDATAPFEVMPAVAEAGTPLPQGGTTIAIAADGAMALDGRPMAEPAILAALTAQAGTVAFVRVNADASAPLRHVLPLVARLEAIGLPRVSLVVTPGVTLRVEGDGG